MGTREFRIQQVTADSVHTQERIYGFNFVETAGAAAVVKLRAGSASGDVINYLNLASGQSGTIFFPENVYVSALGGVYVEVVSGTVAGVLYY